jgi:hypothetical protein
MKLVKLIIFFFGIYLVKRFFDLLKTVQEIKQEQQNFKKNEPKFEKNYQDSIETEFKIIDR